MPKIVDHDRYRQELLFRCFDLFAEKGYAALTMRQIAQGLGVSTGTLYHYFPNKEAIFLQLTEEQVKQDISQFLDQGSQAQTLEERIEALVAYITANRDEFLKQSLLWFEYYQQQGRDSFLKNDVLRRSWQQTRQAIADYLQITDPHVVDFIRIFLEGLIDAHLYEDDGICYETQAELLKTMITTYLQNQKQVKIAKQKTKK